jgi:hypothetical protein
LDDDGTKATDDKAAALQASAVLVLVTVPADVETPDVVPKVTAASGRAKRIQQVSLTRETMSDGR